ncbi:MAG: N-acetylglucosamine-6-phosphate deacetylase [Clostridiales bacterium]|nr:N-acetylglucosamine-6-phosphate deacetylase [Clostridiales bacterium]
MNKVYKNARINGTITDIIVENGIISKIGKVIQSGIDLQGQTALPGLIDIHIHGCCGFDTMDGDKLNEISKFLATKGVTSFLPTTMTVDFNNIKDVVNKPLPETQGAKVLGYHLEGPYIASSRRGAQNINYIRKPHIKEFESLDNILMVTVAPETQGGQDFIKNCKAVVSIGHTDGTYEDCIEAIKNGAKCLTHTFNAMPPLLHREPGPVGAAIMGDAYVQVISDGVHIHPSVIQMLYRTFKKERMVLISDAMKATGMADGLYKFGGQSVKVENSVAKTLDGVVAGSTSDLLTGVKKAVEFGIPKEDAIYMASKTPATLMGLNKGEIKKGFDADFIVVDEELNILKTIVGGNIVFEK